MDESDLERAKENEMAERQASIQAVIDKPDHGPGEEQLVMDGVVLCIDCHDKIQTARLKVKPEAIRCVDCKEAWEKRQ